MSTRIAWLAVVYALVCPACSADDPPGPIVDGYAWGGIAGYACPPGTEGWGDCDGADCMGPCYATQTCSAEVSACPAPSVCDAALGYCAPVPCSTSSDCPNGQTCVTDYASTGLCTTVPDTAPATCSVENECPFPWVCVGQTDSHCILYCIDGQCPGALQCDERNNCVE